MKLIDMTVSDYLALLGSDAVAPGGGSASALAGAQGAQLVAMVAALTLGRPKYEAYQPVCAEAKERCGELAAELAALIDRDAESYLAVSSAYKLPKETDADKAARAAAIEAATLGAIDAPLRTMRLCLEGLKQAGAIAGRSNPNAASDLQVAALGLAAGARGARRNVEINLPGLRDEARRARFGAESAQIAAEVDALAAEIAAR